MMKKLFVIQGWTTAEVAFAVIDQLKFPDEQLRFVVGRGTYGLDPSDPRVLISEDLPLPRIGRNPLRTLRDMLWLDRAVNGLNGSDDFDLFVPGLGLRRYMLIATNPRCRSVSLVEEGIGSMTADGATIPPYSVSSRFNPLRLYRRRFVPQGFHPEAVSAVYCLRPHMFPWASRTKTPRHELMAAIAGRQFGDEPEGYGCPFVLVALDEKTGSVKPDRYFELLSSAVRRHVQAEGDVKPEVLVKPHPGNPAWMLKLALKSLQDLDPVTLPSYERIENFFSDKDLMILIGGTSSCLYYAHEAGRDIDCFLLADDKAVGDVPAVLYDYLVGDLDHL